MFHTVAWRPENLIPSWEWAFIFLPINDPRLPFMADPFSVDGASSGGSVTSGGSITEDGMYKFKVLSAFDSYKVNPEDEDDPERSRRINLRIQVLEAVPDKRERTPDELEEDVQRRQKQKGSIEDVSIWLSKDGNSSLLEGNMVILGCIAGSPQDDRPDEDLEREYYEGKDENGERQYETGQIADRMHVNCSSLVGRDFVAVIQDTDDDFPSFFPWYAEMVPDDKQTPFEDPETGEEEVQTRGNLYSGEDKASMRMKDIFESGGSASESGSSEPAYAGEADTGDDIDDDMPF